VEYVDHGVSGAKERRPALDALMAAVRTRKVDVVACVTPSASK
jgi:DNA invertase Pin-like site-specific DNA recombinase